MAQMKEQIKTPEEEQATRRYPTYQMQSSKLVIRMLTELIELCRKIKEVKAIRSEIKKNILEPMVKGKKPYVQINDLEHTEEINIQLEQNKETRI